MNFYWLTQMLAGTPFALWATIAMGLPWALLLLPRVDWQRRAVLMGLSLAVGPMLLTAWMLLLGVLAGASGQPLLRFDLVGAGTVVLTGVGASMAWRKWRRKGAGPGVAAVTRPPLGWDERLIIVLVVVAVLLRWVETAYLPFTAYDALWVYGSQPRLYFLTGMIPQSVDYYPQFVQLQYLFAQLGVGRIDDHAARAFVPLWQVGSILAAYTLGSLNFDRRTGIYLAGGWALYHHMAQWAHIGDLEVPLTFLITLTAAFLLAAWFASDARRRRRYALIAGLCFGGAMFTKPTAGALILGVALLVVVQFIVSRFDRRRWWPRFETATIMGLACLPLGAVWYVRNIALGHAAIRFPHESWPARATRSADLLGWLLLLLLLVWLVTTLRQRNRRAAALGIAGIVMAAFGVLPSLPWLNPTRVDPPQSHIQPVEALLIGSGVILLLGACAWAWRRRHTAIVQSRGLRISLTALLLALPYFLTWFWSYSYHARLSFAITPLLMLPSVWLLVGLFPADAVRRLHRWQAVVCGALLCTMLLPTLLQFARLMPQSDWLTRPDAYPDDHARVMVGNPGVTLMADYIAGWEAETGLKAVIVAPGEQRLPFFFPLNTIITDTLPTRVDELAGATHFIYGSLARWRYENDEAIDPADNQLVSSLGREAIFEPIYIFGDGVFRYELYELHSDARQVVPQDVLLPLPRTVEFGGFARYWGQTFANTQLAPTSLGHLNFYFEALAAANADYTLLMELLPLRDIGDDDGDDDSDDETDDSTVVASWQTVIAPYTEAIHYRTTLWQAGEWVTQYYGIDLASADTAVPPGDYYVRISFFRLDENGEHIFAPLSLDGQPQQEPGYRIDVPYRVD